MLGYGYLYSLPIGFESFVTSETSLRAFQLLTELSAVPRSGRLANAGCDPFSSVLSLFAARHSR